MPTRPQGTRRFKGQNSAAQIMTGIGNIYSLFLSWRGVTAGDRIVILNSADGTGSDVIEEIILSNANSDGITVPLPAVGKEFDKGLYYLPVVTGGEVNCSIGYDANG